MAGDAGSPQSQPTDLSTRSRGGATDGRKQHFKFKSDMAAYYATFDRPQDLSFKPSVIKSTVQAASEGHIRDAITAVTRSLAPNDNSSTKTPSGCEMSAPDSSKRVKTVVQAQGCRLSKSPNIETALLCFNAQAPLSGAVLDHRPHRFQKSVGERPFMERTPIDDEISGTLAEKTTWRFATIDRPRSLDLRHALASSPDSGLGSTTPSSHAVVGFTPSPNTPSSKRGKRKRKYGEGRGWKFHDLSTDGGCSKKKSYAQNELEIGILQRFQAFVSIKPVLSPDGGKDKLVVVEASEVTDSDLVRCGTALRVVLDKDARAYKLQLLPYTIEEGTLHDQERMIQAVSRMLGLNNEVLCPNAYNALIRAGNQVITGGSPDETRPFTPPTMVAVDGTMMGKTVQASVTPIHQIEALTRSLNTGQWPCLMWHTPQFGFLPRKKKYLPLSKYCANCTVAATAQSAT